MRIIKGEELIMKKYMKPQILAITIETEAMLSGSNGERQVNLYDDVTANPAVSLSKGTTDLWADEDEE